MKYFKVDWTPDKCVKWSSARASFAIPEDLMSEFSDFKLTPLKERLVLLEDHAYYTDKDILSASPHFPAIPIKLGNTYYTGEKYVSSYHSSNTSPTTNYVEYKYKDNVPEIYKWGCFSGAYLNSVTMWLRSPNMGSGRFDHFHQLKDYIGIRPGGALTVKFIRHAKTILLPVVIGLHNGTGAPIFEQS